MKLFVENLNSIHWSGHQLSPHWPHSFYHPENPNRLTSPVCVAWLGKPQSVMCNYLAQHVKLRVPTLAEICSPWIWHVRLYFIPDQGRGLLRPRWWISPLRIFSILQKYILDSWTHLPLDKMAAILANVFFFFNENDRILIQNWWNLFPAVQLTTRQHWFR